MAERKDGFGDDYVLETKKKVYDQIMQYLEIEGYPMEAETDFKEASINDLVYATISPILYARQGGMVYSYARKRRLSPQTRRQVALRNLLWWNH